MTFQDVRRKLKRLAFQKVRTRKHEIWDNGKGRIVVLSKGRGTVKPGTLRSIAAQAGYALYEFLRV